MYTVWIGAGQSSLSLFVLLKGLVDQNSQVVPSWCWQDVGDRRSHWLVRWHGKSMAARFVHGHGEAHNVWTSWRFPWEGCMRQEVAGGFRPGGFAQVHGVLHKETASSRAIHVWWQANHCWSSGFGPIEVLHQGCGRSCACRLFDSLSCDHRVYEQDVRNPTDQSLVQNVNRGRLGLLREAQRYRQRFLGWIFSQTPESQIGCKTRLFKLPVILKRVGWCPTFPLPKPCHGNAKVPVSRQDLVVWAPWLGYKNQWEGEKFVWKSFQPSNVRSNDADKCLHYKSFELGKLPEDENVLNEGLVTWYRDTSETGDHQGLSSRHLYHPWSWTDASNHMILPSKLLPAGPLNSGTNMLKLQDDTLFGGLSLNMDPECNESKPTDFCLNLLYLSSRDSKNWRSKHPQFLLPTRGWAVDGQVRPLSHPLGELFVFVARLFVSLAS